MAFKTNCHNDRLCLYGSLLIPITPHHVSLGGGTCNYVYNYFRSLNDKSRFKTRFCSKVQVMKGRIYFGHPVLNLMEFSVVNFITFCSDKVNSTKEMKRNIREVFEEI